jgi:hypothetical protein
MKAQWCDQCKHYDPKLDADMKSPCGKGHRPRFYKPLTISQAHSGDWGWKRRCEDFERGEE